MKNCVICSSESAEKLVQCKDAESWARLYCAAEIRQFTPILDLSTGKHNFPRSPVKHHFACRKEFVNQKTLQSLSKKTVESSESRQDLPQIRKGTCDVHNLTTNLALLPQTCIFVRRQNTNRVPKHEKNCVASKSLEQMTRKEKVCCCTPI